MASKCPKCHEVTEEDYICCAGVEFQWLCEACHKRTRGFAFPFGRCPLCGGVLTRTDPLSHTPTNILLLQEALQIEISSHLFYNRLAQTVDDPETADFFQKMAEMEKEHAEELSQKYHLHLGNEMFRDNQKPLPYPFFEDLAFFAETGELKRLYDCAISLETKTLHFFQSYTERIPASRERNLYLELAAEEREHIALLETERDRVAACRGDR